MDFVNDKIMNGIPKDRARGWGTTGGEVQYAIKDVDLNPNWFTNINDLD